MSDGALSGLRVIEFADFVSGPFCTKLMADLGAEVLKIERPSSGDTARQTGPFPNDIPHPERSGLFLYLNTNKRSITLDPGTLTGARIFKELAKTADILIENMPPPTMVSLGLDYESLRQINPKLIVTSITPFGQSGPYSLRKANDLICCQMSGLAYHSPIAGADSTENPPLKPGGRQSDYIAGSTAAAATMFAVIARETMGVGQHLDVSQQESVASFLRHQVAYQTYDPEGESHLQQFDTRARIRRVLPCQDGFVVNRCKEESQWGALLRLVAGDGWEKDKRLRGVLDGESDLAAFLAESVETIQPMIVEWTMQQTKEEVIAAARGRDIPIIAPDGFPGFAYLQCRDGFVVNRCREEAQWRALLGLVAGEGWEKDKRLKGVLDGRFDMVAFLSEGAPTIQPAVLEWTMQRTKEEVIAAAQSRNVPIVAPGGFYGFGYMQCKDGYVVCGNREEYQWRDFIALVVGDDWEEDERFKGLFSGEFDIGAFLAVAGPIVWPMMTEWAAIRTREEVTVAAQSRGIPIVSCNTTEDLFRSPQFKERQFFVDIDHPHTGKLRYPGAPYHLSETPWRVDRPAPLLGQDNEEILCNRLGYSKEELASMRAEGIV